MTAPAAAARALADVPEETWARLQAELLAQRRQRMIYAPHVDFVHRHAFDAVRNTLLSAERQPPQPPVPCAVPKGNGPGQRGRHQIHALMLPADEALYMLLCTTAVATAEPVLDRSRVFSSRPATGPEPGLVVPPLQWSRDAATALEHAIATTNAQAVVAIDIAECGQRTDRDALTEDLRQLGLPPGWLGIADDFWASFARCPRPLGVPSGLLANAGFFTVTLRWLDEWCARQGVPSVRLLDDIVMLADDLEAGHRLAAAAEAQLAARGFAVNRAKSGVDTMAAFRARRRRQARRRAHPSLSPAQALARLRATATDDPQLRSIAEGALARLARAGDPAALDHVLGQFGAAPVAARAFAGYVGRFMDDPAVADRMAAVFVAGTRQFDPWQLAWAISAFQHAPSLPDPLRSHLATLAAHKGAAMMLRIAATTVLARFATRAEWAALEAVADATRSPHLRAAIAHGLRFRPAGERTPLLGRWAARDPQVALVATALARQPAPAPAS
ncbi:hypothetical protein EDC65_2706 [Stella humosa]|uniref:Reverse transcriptase (RNA-dependent DNA polymerase) n=1 Tax=Stella humosa TaxID=94 RepID=A0A3N1LK92_9PROT|nr:hypothetical protein [Stella humosa]ROP90846.1 hypothetical protein EDC65_2706 [Stella humosa]BBK34806.1 hypothetical protein STHU_54400 [Stella humosa]